MHICIHQGVFLCVFTFAHVFSSTGKQCCYAPCKDYDNKRGRKRAGTGAALNLTAASEAYLSVIRCCDITLSR